jgi:O-antigen/teichoic acid export membrane protein
MFRNIVQSVFTRGIVALINFLLLLVSARYLGVGTRGEIVITLLNITIIQVLNEVYTGYSLLYFIPKYDLKKIFITGIVFTFFACSAGNVVFYLLPEKYRFPGYEWTCYILSMLVILNTFNCVILLGREKIAMFNLLSFIQPFILLLGMCVYIFVFKEYTLEAYLWPMLISFIIAFAGSSALMFKQLAQKQNVQSYEHKPIFMYGIISQLGVLMYILSNKYSYYFLPEKEDVGMYGTASTLMESILIIANGIAPVFLAKVVNTGNTSANMRMTLALSKASLVISLIAVIVLFLLPDELFVLLLGKGFSGIKPYMLYYAPGIIILSFILIINNYFSATGGLKKVLASNSFGFISTLALAPILVSKYGIRGAAITADISYGLTAVVITFIFFKQTGLPGLSLFTLRQDVSDLKALVVKPKDQSL